MSKRRNRKMVGTNVTEELYQQVKNVADEQDMTVSMFVKQAVTEHCKRLGYEGVDLLDEAGDWGGKRKGSGRPPKGNDKD